MKTDLEYAKECVEMSRKSLGPATDLFATTGNLTIAMEHLISHLEAQQSGTPQREPDEKDWAAIRAGILKPSTPQSGTSLETHLSQGPSAHNSLRHVHPIPPFGAETGTGKLVLEPQSGTSATPDASQDSSPTTASPTTDRPWVAPDAYIAAMTQLSVRLHGALTAAERTAVENDSALQASWGALVSRLSMPVPAVHGTSWTSLKQELNLSAEPESSAESPSASSEGMPCGYLLMKPTQCILPHGHDGLHTVYRYSSGQPFAPIERCRDIAGLSAVTCSEHSCFLTKKCHALSSPSASTESGREETR